MHRLTGPIDRRTNPTVLRAARRAVVLIALAWLLAIAVLRIGFVILAAAAAFGVVFGIYAGSWRIVVPSIVSLLVLSQIPRKEMARALRVFAVAAKYSLKVAFKIFTGAMGICIAVGTSTGNGPLVQAGLIGIAPYVLYQVIALLLAPDPYRPVHLAGTFIIGEKEAIDRAQKIRSWENR